MNHPDRLTASRTTILWNRVKTYFSKPYNVILLLMGIVFTITTISPIVAIVQDTLKIHPGTIDAHLTGKADGYTFVNYIDLFTSRMAKTNLWTPLLNTVLLAVGTCVVAILFGGVVAFLVTRTNMACRKYISSIFIFPYIMPQWTLAVVWQNLFNSNAVTGTANCWLRFSEFICLFGGARACSPALWFWASIMHHLPIFSSAVFSGTWMPILKRQPPFWIPPSGRS